jgi:endoglucanase
MSLKVLGLLSVLFMAPGIGACSQSAAEKSATRSDAHDGVFGATVPIAPQILVDQFGYRPDDAKVAVVRNPQVGFDKDAKFEPGTQYEVRRAGDGAIVIRGPVRAWNGGSLEASSGDNGWWFDFSEVNVPDRYFVYDVQKKVRSPTFSIHRAVYRSVLVAAVRTFYYQRSGFAKRTPFADPCWSDTAAYLGANQDGQAHDVTDRENPAKIRDMSGGWFDAGDTNKYVTFAGQAVHQLLTAYSEHPRVFTDDFNIPESGNGLPDLIDEVKWEVDWLKKMQYADGSVALKVGAIKQNLPSPPSSDKLPRFYVPACTSSTIAAAGIFAHASFVFSQFAPLQGYAADLKSRAVSAWKNYASAPDKQTACDQGIVLAGRADWSIVDQQAYATEAAIYLFSVTGEQVYQDYVKAHYREMRPYRDIGWSRYQPDQGESLLFYTSLKGAEPALRRSILGDKANDVRLGSQVYGFQPNDDLYRAFLHDPQYHWGSNAQRANYGNSNVDVDTYAPLTQNTANYQRRAIEILHYFHGVNPFGMTYLTNMYSLGATRSANEIFHSWYQTKTKWSDALTSECGPPPGYVPGGPNVNAAKDGVPASISPPTGQPAQKSYKDWNGIWPDASWSVTEPGIYYESAYIKLLSAFVN